MYTPLKNDAFFSRQEKLKDFSFEIDLQWFAAEDEGRTEEPSELKLRKAREEGRIAKSQDLNSALVFLFSLVTLIFLAKSIFFGCKEIMQFFFERVNSPEVNGHAFFMVFVNYFAKLVFPIIIVGIVAGIMGNIIQNRGWLFSLKVITPKFSKLLPKFGEYFKNTMFSVRGVFNIAKSIGKVAVIVFVAYLLIRKYIPDLISVIQRGNGSILSHVFFVSKIGATLLVVAAVIFLLIAIPDYFVNRREFMESMKMTKYEVKQEYKEMEGDPEVKSRLKQKQKEILQQNMPKAVREADVVITNPTHFAVSMKYEREVNASPQITAKGQDEVALMMRRIASENNVPIVENKALARSLYAETEVGDIIPEKYFSVLANIYAEILKNNKN